jgi:hypothetical protein
MGTLVAAAKVLDVHYLVDATLAYRLDSFLSGSSLLCFCSRSNEERYAMQHVWSVLQDSPSQYFYSRPSIARGLGVPKQVESGLLRTV